MFFFLHLTIYVAYVFHVLYPATSSIAVSPVAFRSNSLDYSFLNELIVWKLKLFTFSLCLHIYLLIRLIIFADIFCHETITAAIFVELLEASALIIVTFLYYQVLGIEWAECLFEQVQN